MIFLVFVQIRVHSITSGTQVFLLEREMQRFAISFSIMLVSNDDKRWGA